MTPPSALRQYALVFSIIFALLMTFNIGRHFGSSPYRSIEYAGKLSGELRTEFGNIRADQNRAQTIVWGAGFVFALINVGLLIRAAVLEKEAGARHVRHVAPAKTRA